jgi:hypothetical protein
MIKQMASKGARYEAPKLVTFGAVNEITAAGATGTAEPGSGNNPNKRA